MSIERYEDIIALVAALASGAPADPPYRQLLPPARQSTGRSAAASRALASVLARGVILTTALGRCSLAEVQDDPAYPQYDRQVVQAAGAVLVAWQDLQSTCQDLEAAPERVALDGLVLQTLRVVLELAQEIVEEEREMDLSETAW